MASSWSFDTGIEVTKLTEKNYLRTLENAVRFGRWVLMENVLETLDASLEPLLLQQTFVQGGTKMIKIGDSTIPRDLRVLRCCGAFTPSTRLFSMREGAGWPLVQIWADSDRVETAVSHTGAVAVAGREHDEHW